MSRIHSEDAGLDVGSLLAADGGLESDTGSPGNIGDSESALAFDGGLDALSDSGTPGPLDAPSDSNSDAATCGPFVGCSTADQTMYACPAVLQWTTARQPATWNGQCFEYETCDGFYVIIQFWGDTAATFYYDSQSGRLVGTESWANIGNGYFGCSGEVPSGGRGREIPLCNDASALVVVCPNDAGAGPPVCDAGGDASSTCQSDAGSD